MEVTGRKDKPVGYDRPSSEAVVATDVTATCITGESTTIFWDIIILNLLVFILIFSEIHTLGMN